MTKIKNTKNRIKMWKDDHADELFAVAYFGGITAVAVGSIWVAVKQAEYLKGELEANQKRVKDAVAEGRVALTDTGSFVIIEDIVKVD